ncbi:hypothetical protein Tdes44962_MAKER06045 [Teratosphaeria destructans]|uniref:Uncharacterized protein n=1 Tax=Teratosphaeria destructans TaxID=418781 RepID=A0A9W7SIH6_9PEZI|nr:hypothetical protein Tdes44962_MAKER06045 [Teratosphaeria destructans]
MDCPSKSDIFHQPRCDSAFEWSVNWDWVPEVPTPESNRNRLNEANRSSLWTVNPSCSKSGMAVPSPTANLDQKMALIERKM